MSLHAPEADKMTSLMDMGLASLCSLFTASAAGFGGTSAGGAEGLEDGFRGVAVSVELGGFCAKALSGPRLFPLQLASTSLLGLLRSTGSRGTDGRSRVCLEEKL